MKGDYILTILRGIRVPIRANEDILDKLCEQEKRGNSRHGSGTLGLKFRVLGVEREKPL